MSDEGIKAIMNEDGVFEEYNDEYDLTIHFESQEEQDAFIKNAQTAVTREKIDRLKEAIKDYGEGVTISMKALPEGSRLIPRMEGVKTAINEILKMFKIYCDGQQETEQEKTDGKD